MRFLIYLSATALLVAMGLGGTMVARAADRDVRSQIMGRQKIREELSAALAKGYLTRMDQYHILLDAKEVLSPDDLHGLEQTLNRIATRQASARAAATAVPSTIPASPNAADARDTVTTSKYEVPQGEEVPMGNGPGPRGPKFPATAQHWKRSRRAAARPPCNPMAAIPTRTAAIRKAAIRKSSTCLAATGSTSSFSRRSMPSKARWTSTIPTAISAHGWGSTGQCRSFPA